MRCTWASFSSIGIMSFCGTCKWTFPGYFNNGHINFFRALTSFNWIGFCVVNFLMPFNLSGYTTVRFICGDRMTGLQCHRFMGISIKLFKCQIYWWTCYRASDEVTVFICCVICNWDGNNWMNTKTTFASHIEPYRKHRTHFLPNFRTNEENY